MEQVDQADRARAEAERPMPAAGLGGAGLGPASGPASGPATGGAVAAGPIVGPDPAIVDPAEHNVVFTSLVTGDSDIVGLVAYSIYKQNKYDWLEAYSRLQGRMPEPAEVHSYLLGESTPRRLATYRHLAQAVLDGRGPDVPGAAAGMVSGMASGATSSMASGMARAAAPGGRAEPPRGPQALTQALPQALPPRLGIARGRSTFQLSSRAIVALCLALVVLVALLWLMRSGAPLPPTAAPK